MFRVLARAAILMAVAPPAPVSWWPGARTLPESVLSRLPSGATRPVEDQSRIPRLRPSRPRVIAIPIDGGRATPRRTAPLPPVVAMEAPWGEPATPFAGVAVSTRWVPRDWLRPSAPDGTLIPMPVARSVATPVRDGAIVPGDAVTDQRATITALPRPIRDWPPAHAPRDRARSHGRFRRAAALVIGLLVSLVAVEAAARSGRR